MPEFDYSISRPFELKNINDDGRFEGIASMYGNADSYRDVVMPGAFTKTILERGSEVPVLAEHKFPIGKGRVFDAGSHLGIHGTILTSIYRGKEYVELAKAGIVKGLSIGYKTVKESFDSSANVRRLLEIKLYEVSLVTFPANEAAVLSTPNAPKLDANQIRNDDLAAALREYREKYYPSDPIAACLREIREERERARRWRAA